MVRARRVRCVCPACPWSEISVPCSSLFNLVGLALSNAALGVHVCFCVCVFGGCTYGFETQVRGERWVVGQEHDSSLRKGRQLILPQALLLPGVT